MNTTGQNDALILPQKFFHCDYSIQYAMDNDVVVNTKARTTEKFTKSYITTDGNLDKLVDDVFEGI